ncbi:MAG: phosphatidate cytidylyltransferase [Clostridia bacterium]|nr:phosphatidate cytidylyltransferase [Clostridia bacterium]MBR6890158.1 phosphatidate cytidylyltransferase [Clostridia bacterium]
MIKRIITAAALIIIMSLAIWFQGWPLRLLLLWGMLMSTSEMYRAFRRIGYDPVRWSGYAYCVLAVLAQAYYARLTGGVFESISPSMFALIIGLLLAMTVIVLKGKVAFDSMMSTVFPMLYPGLFFSLIITLQDLGTRLTSTLALVLTFFIASVNDTFALFIGMRFGRHKLSPEISPHKSVEGAVAGLVASVLFAMLVPWLAIRLAPTWPALQAQLSASPLPPLWAFGVLGLFAGALSQIGDLVASLVKRHCGIKDFGTIFPGHGGMLDRMDGILFCGVACYVFFKIYGL